MKAGLPPVHHRVPLPFKPADMEQNPMAACTALHPSGGGTGLRQEACVQLSHSTFSLSNNLGGKTTLRSVFTCRYTPVCPRRGLPEAIG